MTYNGRLIGGNSVPLLPIPSDLFKFSEIRPRPTEIDPRIPDGAVLGQDGERWRYRSGRWIKTWTHKPAETKSPQGRARYERRHKNGR